MNSIDLANFIARGLMAANAVNALAVGPVLLPMSRTIDCPNCTGGGYTIYHQCFSDGMLMDMPCTPCLGSGVIANPDFDADALVCSCGNPLHVGDDCRQCGGAR